MRKAGVKLTQEVQSNAVFFTLSEEETTQLRERYFFYDWDVEQNERRLVCSWDTTEEDLAGFVSYLRTIVK
jgi:threonine aldolase